jgi:hypothetical protein
MIMSALGMRASVGNLRSLVRICVRSGVPDAGAPPEKRWNGCRQRIARCGLWVINIPASLLLLIRQFVLVDRSDHCKVAAKDIPVPATGRSLKQPIRNPTSNASPLRRGCDAARCARHRRLPLQGECDEQRRWPACNRMARSTTCARRLPKSHPLDQNGAWSFPRHINVNTGAAFPRGFEYSRPALEWRAFSAFAGTAIKDRLVT